MVDGGKGNCKTCGKPGGDSTFGGNVCVGKGGRNVPNWGIGGAGGAATGGYLNLVGGYGHTGNIDGYGNSEAGGNGGDSYFGGGGAGASHWGQRRPGFNGGGGGGNYMGSGRGSWDVPATGKGGDGIVVIEEFY